MVNAGRESETLQECLSTILLLWVMMDSKRRSTIDHPTMEGIIGQFDVFWMEMILFYLPNWLMVTV